MFVSSAASPAWVTLPVVAWLVWLKDMLGSFGLAILANALLLWILYQFVRRLRPQPPAIALAARIEEIERRHAGDKPAADLEIQQAFAAATRPPRLVPLRILLALALIAGIGISWLAHYQAVPMRGAPFLWIADLGRPDARYGLPAVYLVLGLLEGLLSSTEPRLARRLATQWLVLPAAVLLSQMSAALLLCVATGKLLNVLFFPISRQQPG